MKNSVIFGVLQFHGNRELVRQERNQTGESEISTHPTELFIVVTEAEQVLEGLLVSGDCGPCKGREVLVVGVGITHTRALDEAFYEKEIVFCLSGPEVSSIAHAVIKQHCNL